MKILHLASGDLWAGAEVQLFHLVKQLVQEDDVSILVVLLNPGQLMDELEANGVKVKILNESNLSGIKILWQLNLLVREFKPDIIHTHRNKENVFGGVVSKLNGCKSIRTEHGASEFSFSDFNIKRMIFNMLDLLAGFFLQEKIIAVSDELKGKLLRHYSSSKIKVIENSVDFEYIAKKADEQILLDIDSSQFNVAFIGRFVPVKQVNLFLKIAKATLQENPSLNIHFYMIGDGPLFNDIQEEVIHCNLQKRIHLTGFVSNTAPYLKRMNALLFTSEHEGLPMTLLEAMALGMPVISRFLPTIEKVLCDGSCGYIVKSDEIGLFVKEILTIYGDENGSLNEYIELAKKELQNKYTMHSKIDLYKSLYQELLI